MIDSARRFVLGRTAAAIDVAVTRATEALAGTRRRGTDRLDHGARVNTLAAIEAHYPVDAPGFFRPARPIRPTRTPVPGEPNAVDLVWESGYETFSPLLADRWRGVPSNGWVHARHCGPPRRGGPPRPVIVLVHGYLGGHFAVERKVFPVEWLLAAGLDVVLYTLPFHGLRAERNRRFPRFPGSDPRVTIEGLRQASGELVDLIGHLRGSGHPHVGLMGMSLGGYTTALLATIEPGLAFAVPLIPLADFADFAREQGRLSTAPGAAMREHALLEAAYRVVSPLARTPAIEGRRVLVLAAEHDRVTPVRHAERLAAHFRAPLVTFGGGHLWQVGRDARLTHLATLIKDLAIVPRA